MSRRFIRFYLDEDVSVLVAKLLRARGFDVRTTLDAGNLGASDDRQLDFAAQNGLAIITHNRVHFEALARQCLAAHRDHHGIVIAVRRPAHEIARRLLTVLDTTTPEEMKDQLRYV